MFTLSYTSAYDPYHTIFRFICILKYLSGNTIEYNKLRYVDFYLCFPWLISDISGSRKIPNFSRNKNAITKKYNNNPYEILPDSKTLFNRMEIIQLASLSSLVSEGIGVGTSPNYLDLKIINSDLNEKLENDIKNFTDRHKELLSFLIDDLMQLNYLGFGGLKEKTKLEEYRYDDV